MSKFRDIENSIIQYLKDKFPQFLVQGFPEKPQEFILLHPVGAILVHYRGGNYSQTDAINFISQDKNLNFTSVK
ncbi:MAG: Gp37 family protein [Candidatus Gastranaerophilaceae bacterium]